MMLSLIDAACTRVIAEHICGNRGLTSLCLGTEGHG